MVALGGGEEGRKEKKKISPHSLRYNNIEAVEKPH
jgi:hypothetical protein